LVKSFFG